MNLRHKIVILTLFTLLNGWMLTAVVPALPALTSPDATTAKPIALVLGRETYDRPRITRRILAPSGYVWEDRGDFLDPQEFDNYSLVVWLSGCPTNLNERQIGDLKQWLEAGGRLLHTGQGLLLRGFNRNFKPHPWLGITSWHYLNLPHTRITHPALLPNHPYLQGVDLKQTYHWQAAYHTVRLDTNRSHNIIGTNDVSIFAATPVGRGEIAWLWSGPYRAHNRDIPAESPAFERIVHNVIAAARPLTAPEAISRHTPLLAANPAHLICWQRDWDYAFQDDYVFEKPFPQSDEIVNHLSFNTAIDEYDTHFFLCQSLATQRVAVTLGPLQAQSDLTTHHGHLRLLLSDRAPLVPARVRPGQEELPGKMGRFMLAPVTNSFTIDSWRPRVLWLELSSAGLKPGDYRSRLLLQGESNQWELPLQIKIYPVRMPRQRLAELRYWGQELPLREPFFREQVRQGSPQITLRRPRSGDVRLLESGQTLQHALRHTPERFADTPFPALDFRGAYETNLLHSLAHGLTYIQLMDIVTGAVIARAATGRQPLPNPVEWTETHRHIYREYYRQLCHYLLERGFNRIDQSWGDEPGVEWIATNYVPYARLFLEAGLGAGTTWTVGGFMTPGQLNVFAPYTTDWSMYSIMVPNLFKFMREGSVALPPHATVGLTRGGSGHALRNPFNRSRTKAWELVYYGQPLSFIKMGPIWKEWRYYEGDIYGNHGSEGSRLIAYGSADPFAGSVPLLSSSDWESAREGVDDVNLVRILEWYLDYFETKSSFNMHLKRLIAAIRDDMRGWFVPEGGSASETSGFDGERLREAEELKSKGMTPPEKPGFLVRQKRFDNAPRGNHYRYESLLPPPTPTLEALKKRVLDHLESLRPYVSEVGGSLLWHDWTLVENGKRCFELLTAPGSERLTTAVAEFAARCEEISGCRPAIRESAAWDQQRQRISLLLGTSEDPTIQRLLREMGRTVDNTYPGPGSYLILRQPQHNTILVVGTDEPGLLLGLKNFAVFLEGRGRWLLP